MKKLSLLICLVSSLFFITSCDHMTSPSTQDPTPTPAPQDPAPDPQDPPAPEETPDFEYTAENDIPADQAPFDKKLCYQNDPPLVLSDGDWTLNDIYVAEGILNTKTIFKGSVTNKKIEWKSAVIKFDMSTASESDDESQQTLTEQEEFKNSFDQLKVLFFGDNSEYVTFSNGYLTDNKVVYIANVQLDKVDNIFLLNNKFSNPVIKANPNKTKYVIPYDDDNGIIYLYKDANLNDVETIPENPNEGENQGEEETNEPENTGSETPENSELAKLYNSETDVPALTGPFTADTCPFTGSALVFSNGNWTIEDIYSESEFSAKTITKITYDNTQSNPYNCTSMVYKFDFPKAAGTTTVDYKSYFEKIRNHNDLAAIKDILTFSHGYMTDTSIVIIAETPVEVCQTMYLSKLDLIPLNIIFANPTKSKYYINYGLYEKLYVYKDSDELTSEESNVILQVTQFETQTNSLITQNVSAGLTTITLTDNDFDNFGYYQMKNTNLSLSDGNYTCIQKTVYAFNDGRSQKSTTQFDFSLENGSMSFISGKEIYIIDLSFFELMLAQEADEKLIQEYLALSSDKEKFNFIMSSSGIPIPENMNIVFDNGEILGIEELDKIPSNFIYTQSNESETKYLFNLANIIKKDTIIKKTSDGNFMFETTEEVHGTYDTTITYLIKK